MSGARAMTEDYSAWAGRREERTDILGPDRVNALKASLGDEGTLSPGAPLPHLYHWLYFWDVRPPKGLGPDGHPARGGFLPPVPLPRRMWAGGRLKFLTSLRLGEEAKRVSTILKVEPKSGRSGHLVFVTVQHELFGRDGLAIVEEQDIVYREPAAPGTTTAPTGDAAPSSSAWRWDVLPDPVLLFRYSALTMNGHRIHYDRNYAIKEEDYPGLVVHGPLQATLLAELAVRHLKEPVTGFEYRGQSPAFDGTMLHVLGDETASGATVWTEQAGRKSMTATVSCG